MTDADVVLGYIDPNYYLGGKINLNAKRAQSVVAKIAESIGHTPTEAADGIFSIVNAKMINGIRVVSFGGAGAVHATALIEELEVDSVIIPQLASGFSAFGMLCTDLHRDFVMMINKRLSDIDAELINSTLADLAADGLRYFNQSRDCEDTWSECVADMRYAGQAHDIRVPLPSLVETLRQIIDSYNETYHRSYSYLLDENTIQLIDLRVSVFKSCPKPGVKTSKNGKPGCDGAKKGRRKAYFSESGDFVDTYVYDGAALEPGNRLQGPAIVELPTTTVVVRPGQTLRMDNYRNYVVARRGVQP